MDHERAISFGLHGRYDRVRPRYPSEAIDHVMKVASRVTRRVLEIGCGTGICTRAFLRRGADVVAIDPDADMLAVARSRSDPTDLVSWERARFEDWDPEARVFDLVVAAQSWHWVEAESGRQRVADVLRSGGALALLWNRPSPDGFEHREALDEVYRAVAPNLVPGAASVFTSTLQAEADRLREIGSFQSIETKTYAWSRTLTSDEYVGLLGTHSDHSLLDADTRERLFDEVRGVLAGGTIDARYHTVVVSATRA